MIKNGAISNLNDVDIFSYKLNHKIKHEACINTAAISIFVLYSVVVSVSYMENLRYDLSYQLVYAGFVIFFTLIVFGFICYAFIKATLAMKQASRDFDLGFNTQTFRVNLVVISFETASAVIWSIGLLYSSLLMT